MSFPLSVHPELELNIGIQQPTWRLDIPSVIHSKPLITFQTGCESALLYPMMHSVWLSGWLHVGVSKQTRNFPPLHPTPLSTSLCCLVPLPERGGQDRQYATDCQVNAWTPDTRWRKHSERTCLSCFWMHAGLSGNTPICTELFLSSWMLIIIISVTATPNLTHRSVDGWGCDAVLVCLFWSMHLVSLLSLYVLITHLGYCHYCVLWSLSHTHILSNPFLLSFNAYLEIHTHTRLYYQEGTIKLNYSTGDFGSVHLKRNVFKFDFLKNCQECLGGHLWISCKTLAPVSITTNLFSKKIRYKSSCLGDLTWVWHVVSKRAWNQYPLLASSPLFMCVYDCASPQLGR